MVALGADAGHGEGVADGVEAAMQDGRGFEEGDGGGFGEDGFELEPEIGGLVLEVAEQPAEAGGEFGFGGAVAGGARAGGAGRADGGAAGGGEAGELALEALAGALEVDGERPDEGGAAGIFEETAGDEVGEAEKDRCETPEDFGREGAKLGCC